MKNFHFIKSVLTLKNLSSLFYFPKEKKLRDIWAKNTKSVEVVAVFVLYSRY